MNEIITKLDEIEKKAESILTEAAAEKEKMLKQLEFDKREMDGRYTSMRQKQEEEIKQQLLSEAETKITRQREHYEAAKRRLEEDFGRQRKVSRPDVSRRRCDCDHLRQRSDCFRCDR